jgi:hypothetical protein
MPNVKHVYEIVDKFVYSDIRPRRENEFSGFRSQPFSADVRKPAKLGNGGINGGSG